MGESTLAVVTIHCEPQIAWQPAFAAKMSAGLDALGIENRVSASRERESDIAILLGTSMWRGIEATGRYLLVDRASFRDPEFVTLVWDRHGRRGNHCVPRRPKCDRWALHGVELHPWRAGMGHVVLCGQTESYSPKWCSMGDWYRSAGNVCTHFRPHPAQPVNPTLLPEWTSFDGVARMITLNSSVAVDAIIRGIPTVVEDEGGMAWPGFTTGDDRIPWLRWLAWTQWHHDEIAAGEPIRHLFDRMI